MADTFIRDGHGRPRGLDWGAITVSEPAGAPKPAPAPARRRKTPSRPRSAPSSGGRGGPPPVYDRAEIRRLYESGLSVRQVAAKLGAHPSTVSRAVREAGIARTELQSKGGHPPLKERCVRGHEFTPENTRQLKGGGRSCKECERIRGRKAHKDSRASVRGVDAT